MKMNETHEHLQRHKNLWQAQTLWLEPNEPQLQSGGEI